MKQEGGDKVRKYSLTATHDGRSTTVPIFARNDFGAKSVASAEIIKRHASDKRFDKGEIILKSPEGKQTMKIVSEEKG